ncbi:diacylglycerol/lipid kinase family protein [Rhizorhabdus dicambivorans]|uniref:Diacylglycerol kinase n=1 Tax=Rhizorhabdus dicambivorans TaxID=1850238 RepID=A0A2A4FUP3_9SPHN|nr:YegS/Rv2252/BmrU family lipid kinase [Rhizorhabdus dicambivorans]ATE65526.1 diacylglycerol kinase [Rhizorhabdus dicambivorans]PCE41869.1 diacylglycerol kinase [Rhizorhabdus dicambivorans]
MPDQSPPSSAVLIVNALSRQGRKQFEAACAKLRDAGIELTEAIAVEQPGTLPDRVARVMREKPPMLIVGGGDGSLSCAVDELVGTDTVFSVLPLGTANSFARSLGIPLDLDGAIDVITGGERRRIDLGMIDGDYYCNCAAIGLSTKIGGQIPPKLKKSLGRLGYLIWAAWQSMKFRSFKLIVIHDGVREEMDALEVRIANGPYHGGVELVDEADPESGEIVVQAVVGRSPSQLGWSWLASWLRLRARKDTTVEYRGRAIEVETIPPLKVSIDGEVLAKTPFTAKIAPKAVWVMVPCPSPKKAEADPE